MRYFLLTVAVCLLGSSAIAKTKTVTVTTKDGEQGTFEVLTDDPDLAPNLYIGILGFGDLGLGKVGPQYGFGGDLQYTLNNMIFVSFSYMSGVSGPQSDIPAVDRMRFKGMDASFGYYFSSDVQDTEAMIKIKSDVKGNTTIHHVFNMPCKVQKMLGVKLGYSSYDLPVNHYISDGTNVNNYMDLTLAAARATIFSAGLKRTSVYKLELDSKEFGERSYSPRASWYAEALFSPSPAGIYYHRAEVNGVVEEEATELKGYEHSYKIIKAGMRIGYERTAVFWKKSGIGTLYRFEAGYRPGIKSFGGGLFLKADFALNFGAKLGR
jgi:hypothetical protein